MRRWWPVVVCASVVGAAGGVASAGPLAAEPGLTVTFLRAGPPAIGRTTPMPIRVSNALPGKALGVTLSVQTPTWVRLAGPGCVRRRAALVCAIHDLDPGAGVTVRIVITQTRAATYRIVAQASAKTIEPADRAPAPVRGRFSEGPPSRGPRRPLL
jgi:hypothetical protein